MRVQAVRNPSRPDIINFTSRGTQPPCLKPIHASANKSVKILDHISFLLVVIQIPYAKNMFFICTTRRKQHRETMVFENGSSSQTTINLSSTLNITKFVS